MTRTRKSRHGIAAAGVVASMSLAGTAWADQVFSDDVIAQFSLCVGNDCVNGENFGFDTLRLKENNLRIHFDDTSSSASFPRNDWRLIANDSANGGASYLGIEDSTAGRMPFRVEAGAPANALYVEADGDVGVKTANPVVDLHVVEGNTPTLRLEQDGSDGFAPQTWDIAGNETNFFIRDVTNGSTLPFRIQPGAPSSTIYIADDGNVGMGAGTSPAAALHVRGTDGDTKFLVEEASATVGLRQLFELENNGDVIFLLRNNDAAERWAFATSPGRLNFNFNGSSTEMSIDSNGDLVIAGSITTSGSCSVGCDAVFTPEYEVLPIAARAAMMYDLGHLPNVGPTAEAGQYNLTQKMLGMLNELEHAHIYIAQLNDRIEVLEARLAPEQ